MSAIQSRARSAPSTRRAPSTAWFWVAALIGLAGLAAAGIWAGVTVVSASHHVEGFARTTVPGEVTVTVGTPATRYVYYEGDPRPGVADLGLEVTGPDGAPVEVRPYGPDLQYDAFDRAGHAVATFRADEPGAYRVSADATALDGYLAVGDGFGVRIAWPLIGAGLLALVPVVGAITLAVVVAVRRTHSRLP